MVEYSCFTWWDKLVFAFCISFGVTIITSLIRNKDKGIIEDNGGNDSEPIMKEIVKNNSSKIIKCSKDINNINDNNNKDKDEENKLLKNKLINSNRLVKIILKIIMGLFIFLWGGLEFGYFNTIFCDPTDGESTKIASENKDGKGKEKQGDSYNLSASIAKGVIKEAVEGAIEGISNAVPVIVGGMVGGTLGVAVIKAARTLPPVQKAALGVGTAIVSAFGVTGSTSIARELVKNVSKKEEGKPLSVSSLSNNTTGSGDSGKDGLIASILESGDELSPLQMILNYEILLGVVILLHMCLLILI